MMSSTKQSDLPSLVTGMSTDNSLAWAQGDPALSLSPRGDLDEAANRLFSVLRQADALAGQDGRIAVAPVPMQGIGLAINDRLTRAAAPRPQYG
jgi:hypothetical protein